MRKYWIQYTRYIIQALFLMGLWWPILPSSEIIGQQLFLTIFFVGVFFCGWICPFGTLQEWLGHFARLLKLPRFQMPRKAQNILQISRYAFWIGTFFGFSFILLSARSAFVHRLFMGTLTGISAIILILFIILSLFIDRPFCNYFCTMGAFYGLMSPLRLFGIKRNINTCIHCHLCTKKCPMNIAVENTHFVRHPNCINCMQCVGVCPKKCLGYRCMFPIQKSTKNTPK